MILAHPNETKVGKLRFVNCNSTGYAICVSYNEACNATKPDFIKSRDNTHSIMTTTALSLLNATSNEMYSATKPYVTKNWNSTHSPMSENDTFPPENERKSDDHLYILGYQLPYDLGIVLLIVVPIITILLISLVLIACSFIYNRLHRRSNESRRPSTNYETIYTGSSEGSSNYAKTLIDAKYENCEGKNYANIPDSSPRDSEPVFIDDKYGYMVESLPRRIYQNDNSYEIPTNSRRRL